MIPPPTSASNQSCASQQSEDRSIQIEPEPAFLEYYQRKDVPMAHLNIYRAFPWLWGTVGHTYRELNVVAGSLFFVGAVGFAGIPYLGLEMVGTAYQRNVSFATSVVVFLVAKMLLELRAV